MKKIINVLKKVFLMVGAFWSSLYTKVIAFEINNIELLYGPPIAPCMYGVPEPNKTMSFLKIIKGLIIPIVFIIGAIIYFKKSSSNILKKLITILIVLGMIVLFYWGINYIITNLK